MKRMCCRGKGLESARSISFDHFLNITVMKMVRDPSAERSVSLKMDMQKLKHLKSMELSRVDAEAVGLGLVESLCFLRLWSVTLSEAVVDDIGHLTNLRVLVLVDKEGERLPNVSKLISLEEVQFPYCYLVTTISGFSSRLSKLRILNLRACWALRSLGPGVGDLVALHELRLDFCSAIEELPNLQKLTSLRTLNIGHCSRIKSVPGLDNLVALEQLLASNCKGIVELPNMQKLTSLRMLDISFSSSVKSLPGLDELVALRQLKAWLCSSLAKLPDMRKLTNLQVLDLRGCPLKSAPGMGALIALQELDGDFRQLPQQPDLWRYSLLRDLRIVGCSSQEVFVRILLSLSVLVKLRLKDCTLGDEMPDCQSLNRLKVVEIDNCDFKDLSALSSCTALERLGMTGCRWLERLPDLHKLPRLESLSLEKCDMLRDVHFIGRLSQLEGVNCGDLPLLMDFPDLRYFPQLKWFLLNCSVDLVRLECTGPLVALEYFNVSDCRNLITVPDMSHFPTLRKLHVEDCNSLMKLTCSGALTSLEEIDLTGCCGLKAIPDLSGCLRLKALRLGDCQSLMKLTCISPLAFLEELNLGGCLNLNEIPNLVNVFSQLKVLRLCGLRIIEEVPPFGSWPSLKVLDLSGCKCSIITLDLSTFSKLKVLRLRGWESLEELVCTGPLASLKELDLEGCKSLIKMPDRSKFLKLQVLRLHGCESLVDLTWEGADWRL